MTIALAGCRFDTGGVPKVTPTIDQAVGPKDQKARDHSPSDALGADGTGLDFTLDRVAPSDVISADVKQGDSSAQDTKTSKKCGDIYGQASFFLLCSSTGNSCRFYESTYPQNDTCAAVCQRYGGTCLSAETPAGWSDDTQKCASTGETFCSASAAMLICTCSRF